MGIDAVEAMRTGKVVKLDQFTSAAFDAEPADISPEEATTVNASEPNREGVGVR
jgi:hypothetical protein